MSNKKSNIPLGFLFYKNWLLFSPYMLQYICSQNFPICNVVIVLHEDNNCLIVANITKLFLNLAVAYRNLFQEKNNSIIISTQGGFAYGRKKEALHPRWYSRWTNHGAGSTKSHPQGNKLRWADFQNYVNLNETYRNKLLHFIMGKNGLSITYDTVFRHVMLPGGDTKRLEHFLSIIFDQPIHIKQLLPREGSQIVENGSFVIADIIASLR